MPDQPLLGVAPDIARRLWGRYGSSAKYLVAVDGDLLTFVPGTPYLWAELLWAVKHESVFHLDDLLLRRFRLGILLSDGGQRLFTEKKSMIQKNLNWDNKRWNEEVDRYLSIWRTAHGFPHAWLEDRNRQK
jgi:glycerol-3-phosphate dehydrogenase